MAITFEPWVSETGTLTGTDPTYTVPNAATTGSGNQYLRTIGAAFASATDIVLSIASASPNQAEMSVWSFTPGTGGAAGTITRTQLIKSSTGSAINWAGVTCTIECTEPLPTQTSAGATSAGLLAALGSGGAFSPAMVPQLGRYRTSNWYGPQCAGLVSVSVANSQLYFFPFIVFEPWTFQNIGVTASANPSATTNLRLGLLYDGGGRPGKLLFDAGTASITTSGGGNTLSLSGLGQVQPGVYWGIIGTDSSATANGIALAGAGNDALIQSLVGATFPVGNGNVNANYLVGYWLAWTFGAFASDYSTASLGAQSTKMPFLGLQA